MYVYLSSYLAKLCVKAQIYTYTMCMDNAVHSEIYQSKSWKGQGADCCWKWVKPDQNIEAASHVWVTHVTTRCILRRDL